MVVLLLVAATGGAVVVVVTGGCSCSALVAAVVAAIGTAEAVRIGLVLLGGTGKFEATVVSFFFFLAALLSAGCFVLPRFLIFGSIVGVLLGSFRNFKCKAS